MTRPPSAWRCGYPSSPSTKPRHIIPLFSSSRAVSTEVFTLTTAGARPTHRHLAMRDETCSCCGKKRAHCDHGVATARHDLEGQLQWSPEKVARKLHNKGLSTHCTENEHSNKSTTLNSTNLEKSLFPCIAAACLHVPPPPPPRRRHILLGHPSTSSSLKTRTRRCCFAKAFGASRGAAMST